MTTDLKPYIHKIIFLFFAYISNASQINAYWIEAEDAISIKNKLYVDVKVNADGTYSRTIETETTLISENARDKLATETIFFSDFEELEIIEAKTVIKNKDQTTEYPVGHIEKKPLASTCKGFDQQWQALISFPNAELNSILHLKYKITTKKVASPGQFCYSASLNSGELALDMSYTINSDISLQIHVNDPQDYFEVTKTGESSPNRYTYFQIKNKRPYIQGTVMEQENSFLPKHMKTYFEASSYENATEVAQESVLKYEEVISQELPKTFKQIAEQARKESSPVKQINYLTSTLADQVKYMGSWNTVEGQHIPQSFATVAHKGEGDCKDFASITVAMLRHLGFKADVALVYRALNYEDAPHLPLHSNYNHAIASVIIDGQRKFIDPTNYVSMADGIFPDIADRHTFILNVEKPEYLKIPPVDPMHSRNDSEETLTIRPDGSCSIKGARKFSGESQIPFAGLDSQYTPSITTNHFKNITSRSLGCEVSSLTYSPLKSRIVSPLEIQYSADHHDGCLSFTNFGFAFAHKSCARLSDLYNAQLNHVHSLHLGTPHSFHNVYNIVWNAPVDGLKKLELDITTKWFDFTRTVTQNKDYIIKIEEFFALKESTISAKDLQEPSMQKIIAELKKKADCTIILSTEN